MTFQMPSRWWTYKRSSWMWKWTWGHTPFRLGVPFLNGGDEYGRHVIVWGTFVTGYVCFAWKVCRCADCVDARLFWVLKDQFDEEFAHEVVNYRFSRRNPDVRVSQLPPDGTRRV